jgi:hypothetical protein
MSDDLVLTPGGYRPRSMVHAMEPGMVLDGTDGVLRKRDPGGHVLAELGPLAQLSLDREPAAMSARRPVGGAPRPALGSGWITYASWLNTTGTPVSQFTTIWEVPPEPQTHNGQTLFLFNGIENASMIFQPVLQWGPSAAGGGDYWSVATWYVGAPGTTAAHSANVQRVIPGQPLIGVMTLVDRTPTGFSYDGGFFGIADSGWSIQNQPELTFLVETLEAYNLTARTDYPSVSRTTMAGIDIKQGDGRPCFAWAVNDAVTDIGQHTLVHDDSPDDGSVDLWYRDAPRIDDVVLWPNGKAYLFHGDTYVRYDPAADKADPGYPAPIKGNWRGLPDRFTRNLDAAVLWPNHKAYLFKGNQYCRYDVAGDAMDRGYPARIAGNWPGFPPAFEASVDAAVVWNNGKAYFFKGDQYIRYDVASDRTDPGYPLPIAGNWAGLPGEFQSGIDAVVLWNNGKAYLFKGRQYVRYDLASDRVDAGYPLPIAGNWVGLPPAYT